MLLALCAGQIAGIEAAVHAMKASFQYEDTEAVLLVEHVMLLTEKLPFTT